MVLAGKEGLSSVIARGLADFVASKTAADQSFEKFHFEIFGGDPETTAPTEVIGFEGTQLVSKSFALDFSPFDDDEGLETDVQIYRTRLGTLVILAAPKSDEFESPSAFGTYETHQSVKALMSGVIVGCMDPTDRHGLLREVTVKLGKDGVTWID